MTIPREAKQVRKRAGEMDAYARLRRSYAVLKEEHEILKKSQPVQLRSKGDRYKFIESERLLRVAWALAQRQIDAGRRPEAADP